MKNFFIDPEDFNKAYCSAWVATAIVGSAVVGGAVQAYSANKAAEAQTNAANLASQTQMSAAEKSNQLLKDQYDQTRKDLSSYRDLGQYGIDQLKASPDLLKQIDIPQEMLDLRKPLTIDQAGLENLPGYQFALAQSQKAAANSAAARGLGVSGAALKGAAEYAKGVADKSFADYFSQEQQNRQNAYSRYDTTLGRQIQQQQSAYDRLKGLIDTGQSAAAQTSTLGLNSARQQSSNITGAATQVGSNIIGAGNAQAGAATATGNAISKATNDIGGYMAYRGLYGGGGDNDFGKISSNYIQ